GFVSIVVVVDSVKGIVASGPEIHARGHVWPDNAFEPIKQPIVKAVNRAISEGATDTYQLQQAIRRTFGRWVSSTHRRRPMIVPVVIEA
ncbi:MAG TPA: RNase J family beta-CASP ribonuclease, partial [Nocardioides sp.]